jgi:hypothetical protein
MVGIVTAVTVTFTYFESESPVAATPVNPDVAAGRLL